MHMSVAFSHKKKGHKFRLFCFYNFAVRMSCWYFKIQRRIIAWSGCLVATAKTQRESSEELSNHCKLCSNLWKSSQDPFGMEIYLFPWFINLDWPVISDRQQAISSRNVKIPDSPGTDILRFLVQYRGCGNITLGETDRWRQQYCSSDVRQ